MQKTGGLLMGRTVLSILFMISVIAAMWTHDDTYTLEQAIEINKGYQQQARD